jgi:Holliday junction resolvase RusA-like endonuclease
MAAAAKPRLDRACEGSIIITMSSPPSLNKLWSSTGKGRVRSTEYRAWAAAAGWEVKRQIIGMPPIACRYDMTIQVPISRRDTGNYEKAIGDLLESVGVVTNDGNVHRLAVEPMARTDCAVCITPLPAMGGVRKPASVPWRQSRPVKARPTQRQLDLVSALHAKVRFRWTIPRAHRVRP